METDEDELKAFEQELEGRRLHRQDFIVRKNAHWPWSLISAVLAAFIMNAAIVDAARWWDFRFSLTLPVLVFFAVHAGIRATRKSEAEQNEKRIAEIEAFLTRPDAASSQCQDS